MPVVRWVRAAVPAEEEAGANVAALSATVASPGGLLEQLADAAPAGCCPLFTRPGGPGAVCARPVARS
ncbi:hypothetical protein [Streptomyces sp. NPDC001851]|uniref:hypothetical protein n=1 Tax=Streptomyces sp. NPDC001851 TaxID=3154529 RepID=UPI00332707C7